MCAAGLAQMPVKPRRFTARICASLVALSLAFTPLRAGAESDGGVVLDAPRIIKLPNGHYDVNPPAWDAVDGEMRRLQKVESAHKAEPSWATVLLVGVAIGAVAGAVAGASVALAVAPKSR